MPEIVFPVAVVVLTVAYIAGLIWRPGARKPAGQWAALAVIAAVLLTVAVAGAVRLGNPMQLLGAVLAAPMLLLALGGWWVTATGRQPSGTGAAPEGGREGEAR